MRLTASKYPSHLSVSLSQCVHFDKEKIAPALQGAGSGPARLFVRPYDMSVVPPENVPFKGTVKRVHRLGQARRVEIALGSAGRVIEINTQRADGLGLGREIGLSPQRYRIFPSTDAGGDIVIVRWTN